MFGWEYLIFRFCNQNTQSIGMMYSDTKTLSLGKDKFITLADVVHSVDTIAEYHQVLLRQCL